MKVLVWYSIVVICLLILSFIRNSSVKLKFRMIFIIAYIPVLILLVNILFRV